MFRRLFLVLILSGCISGVVAAKNSSESLIDQGFAQVNQGNLDAAMDLLQQAVKEDPNSSLAHSRLGGVQVLKQDYKSGIQSFRQAIMLDQKNANAFVGMAVAYLQTGQYSMAKAALKEAENIDPSKKPEIGKVLTWIEQRSASTKVH